VVLLYIRHRERVSERVRGVIRKVAGGWKGVRENGKNLSRVLKSLSEAKARLSEIEYFKRKGK